MPGVIYDSAHLVNILDIYNCGGVVGCVRDNGAVLNCANRGNVSGSTNVGGIVGEVIGGGNTVKNIFSTGKVIGSGEFGNVAARICNVVSYFNFYALNTLAGQAIGKKDTSVTVSVMNFNSNTVVSGGGGSRDTVVKRLNDFANGYQRAQLHNWKFEGFTLVLFPEEEHTFSVWVSDGDATYLRH